MEKVRRHQHAFTQRVALYTVPLAALWVPPAQAQVSFELLHPFVHQSQTEGWSPNALVQGTDGNFYGTNAGGSGADPSGLGGTAYMMRPDGTLVVLHAFGESPADGQEPGDLLQASDGNLYGMTYLGGMFNRGIVFRLTPTGGFTALHHFGEGADGAYPRSPLIQADDGLLYGTTEFGGMSGGGTVFRMTLDGVVSVMHDFAGGTADGWQPGAALVQATDGNFYGTTNYGGAFPFGGTIFRMTRMGTVTVLRSIDLFDGDYSQVPLYGLVQARDGNLYGTTGANKGQLGTLFRVGLDGTFGVLRDFHGSLPPTALIQGSDGQLYGMAPYYVLSLTLDGVLANLHTFNITTEGAGGWLGGGRLLQARDGRFYGATVTAGPKGGGGIFRLTVPGVPPVFARAPIAWRQTQTGDVAIGLTRMVVASRVSFTWQIVQVGDLDGNGSRDLVWRQTQTGDVAVWFLRGAMVAQAPIIASGVPLAWQIVGVGDLDGDGREDLVWRHRETGDVAVWLMSGSAITQAPIIASSVPLPWEIVGVGDLDGDGKADLVWRHTQTGDVAVWVMDGVSIKQAPVVSPGVPQAWQIAGVGDLDGDGKVDLVWRHTQTGDVAVWFMDGLIAKQAPVIARAVPLAWEIAGVGDLDGDSKPDLLWREMETGDLATWLMSGATVKQSSVIAPGVPLTWQIQ